MLKFCKIQHFTFFLYFQVKGIPWVWYSADDFVVGGMLWKVTVGHGGGLDTTDTLAVAPGILAMNQDMQ